MRLARIGALGAEKAAVLVTDDLAVDVSDAVPDFGPEFFAGDGIAVLRDLDLADRPRMKLAGFRLGACVTRPGKIIGVGLNYVDHALEVDMPTPAEPVTFLKAPSSLCGPYDDLLLPLGGDKTDWEVELAVVIGKPARYLRDADEALGHIAAVCLSNDVSERSFQLEHGDQWSKGKSCETFQPLGPWLVTPDELAGFDNLELELRVNGEIMQSATTKDMIFSVGEIVRYLSQFMVLEPGDVINTGTPPGTGMGLVPPRYLREKDVIEATITGLGTQRQRCVRASR